MSVRVWFCEAEGHVGERRVHLTQNQFTRRETFMRVDGGQRLHERSLGRICRACIEHEAAGRSEQVSLF